MKQKPKNSPPAKGESAEGGRGYILNNLPVLRTFRKESLIVPTLQRGNAAGDAPASQRDGENVWVEAAM